LDIGTTLLVIFFKSATISVPSELKLFMLGTIQSFFWPIGILLVGGVCFGLFRYFNPAAMDARRRARNHGPVITRRSGPTIRLAVDVDEPPKGRKR
jgi:hypothetical protein